MRNNIKSKKYYYSLTYRSFVGIKKDICKTMPFDSFNEALIFGKTIKIPEDGLSIYSSEDGINFTLELHA